jgi:Tol biopolymer transport system component/DNA-binding winged helix-turn-helix (wHTH) protein
MFQFGDFRLDVREHRFTRGSAEIPLPPKAFDLLALFVAHPGELLTKEVLLRELWPNSFVEEGALSVYVSALRKALGDTAGTSKLIETLPKKGYRFVGRVVETGAPASQSPRARFRTFAVASIALLAAIFAWKMWPRPGSRELTQYALEKGRPLTSSPGIVSQPALSPDGTRTAYVWEAFDGGPMRIFVQAVGSSDRVQLTTLPGYSVAPAWSPDGRQIAFLYGTRDGGPVDLMLTDLQIPNSQRKLVRLGNFVTSEFPLPSLDWSPDGKFLLGTDTTSESHFPSLASISVATGEKTFLTRAPPQSADIDGRYSWDGKTIAFRRCIGSSVDDIYVMPAAGGAPRRLTNDLRRIRGLTWSSEGRSLIVASNRASALTSLWRVFLDGQPAVELTTPVVHASGPVVARGVKRLAFVSEVNDVNIWKAPVNGSTPPVQLVASTYLDSSPDISSDGARIAFRSDRTGSNEIWMADSDGRNPRQLTHFGGALTGCPRWSPDGHWLAFDSRASGYAEIYKLRLDDGTPTRLTESHSDNIVPSWSHDGRFIYFTSNRTGSEQIWKVPAEGGAETQITSSGGFGGVESTDGRTIYYVKDLGKTSIWSMPAGGGPSTEVIDAMGPRLWGYWAVSAHYLTFLHLASLEAGSAEILQLNLATQKVRRIGATERAVESGTKGFSISRDEQWIFYAQHDVYQTSIMLADGLAGSGSKTSTGE